MNNDLKLIKEFLKAAEEDGVIEEDIKEELFDFAKWFLANEVKE